VPDKRVLVTGAEPRDGGAHVRWKLALLASVISLTLMAVEQPAQFAADADGKTITLRVGERFDVTLAGNLTTGFSWEVLGGLGGVIEQVGKPDYRPSSSDKNLVGAPGTVTFHFRAAAAGTAELKLVYHKNWEKDTPPAKTFHLTAEVRE
jgi:inhibitor of cysteine peptidase